MLTIRQVDLSRHVFPPPNTNTMDFTTIFHISALVGSMSYSNPSFSSGINIGPSPYGAPSTMMWIESHSMYTVSTFVGSTYVSHTSLTYGVDWKWSQHWNSHPLNNDNNTTRYPYHAFHSNEDILEAMITPNYPWDDMHHHSYFLPRDDFTPSEQYPIGAKDFISPMDTNIGSKPHPSPSPWLR